MLIITFYDLALIHKTCFKQLIEQLALLKKENQETTASKENVVPKLFKYREDNINFENQRHYSETVPGSQSLNLQNDSPEEQTTCDPFPIQCKSCDFSCSEVGEMKTHFESVHQPINCKDKSHSEKKIIEIS